jgi:hypothetical protein
MSNRIVGIESDGKLPLSGQNERAFFPIAAFTKYSPFILVNHGEICR